MLDSAHQSPLLSYDRFNSEVIYRDFIDPTIDNKVTNFIKVVGRERRALSFLKVF